MGLKGDVRQHQLLLSQHSADLVVMNPPYGSFIPKVKAFVKVAYPLTKNDIYAACDMEIPEDRIWLARQRRRKLMPYFNALRTLTSL